MFNFANHSLLLDNPLTFVTNFTLNDISFVFIEYILYNKRIIYIKFIKLMLSVYQYYNGLVVPFINDNMVELVDSSSLSSLSSLSFIFNILLPFIIIADELYISL
jgi:hypothetical protein